MTDNIVHIHKNMGWKLVSIIYPNHDLYEHLIASEKCTCKPYWDGNILVHNAYDGRTKYEAEK